MCVFLIRKYMKEQSSMFPDSSVTESWCLLKVFFFDVNLQKLYKAGIQ